MELDFLVGVLGVLFLSHAAYSTIQYRGLLKIIEEEFSGPPLNVVVELIFGFAFCTYAALSVPGKFHSIKPDSEENRKQYGPFDALHLMTSVQNIDFQFNFLPMILSISFTLEVTRIVSLSENLDFMTFNHRGRAILSETDIKLKL